MIGWIPWLIGYHNHYPTVIKKIPSLGINLTPEKIPSEDNISIIMKHAPVPIFMLYGYGSRDNNIIQDYYIHTIYVNLNVRTTLIQ